MIEGLQSTAADPEVALPSQAAAGDQAFPTLNEAQIARIAAHGRARKVERGEVLVKAGARNASFFVVVSGHLEIVRLSDGVETLIVVHKPGQVSGELNVLSGRRAVFPSAPAKQAKSSSSITSSSWRSSRQTPI